MSLGEGREQRDEALELVEQGADPEWMTVAREFVMHLLSGQEFTTDRVWWNLDLAGVTTPEPRALGAVMKNLCDRKIIEKTGEYRPSTRPQAHARPIPVWRRL